MKFRAQKGKEGVNKSSNSAFIFGIRTLKHRECLYPDRCDSLHGLHNHSIPAERRGPVVTKGTILGRVTVCIYLQSSST